MAPRVKIWEDVVYVAFPHSPWVAVNEDGTTDIQWREPNDDDESLFTEEDAIIKVLDSLLAAGIDEKALRKIEEHFGIDW